MKRYLLPVTLILGLGLTYALGQNITKSLQQSQSTGAFGVDSSNNVYFPAHILSLGKAPALSSCGSGSPVISGSDYAGTVTLGTSATGCVITFKVAYAATPWCVVTSQTALVTTPIGYTLSATAITETQPSTSSNIINYFCSGAQ